MRPPIVFAAVMALGLAGCITSPEEVAAREEAQEEAIRQLMAEGKCREIAETGSRVRTIWYCTGDGERTRQTQETANEAVRRMQNQGAIGCGPQGCRR